MENLKASQRQSALRFGLEEKGSDVKNWPKGRSFRHFTAVHQGLEQGSSNLGCLCFLHKESGSKLKKGEQRWEGDLTFGSAGVDSGTQPDQLVSILRSKVLDTHQHPVWLTQTQTHTIYYFKGLFLPLSSPLCKESTPPTPPCTLPKAERNMNKQVCACIDVHTIKCSNYRRA